MGLGKLMKTQKSKRFVKMIFRRIPGYIDGTYPDRHRIGSVFWSNLSYMLFLKAREMYRIKSEGGTDELGNKWKPLAKSTVAKRPIGKGGLNKLGLTKKQSDTAFKDRSRGLLTPAQNAQWKKIYAGVLSRLITSLPEKAAKAQAAKIAWGKLKKAGAETKKEKLGNRNVLIMRVTDTIYDSLKPSNPDGSFYRPRKNQLYHKVGNMLSIGTLVEYAHFHNSTRPVFPDNFELIVPKLISIAMEHVLNHIRINLL